MIECKMTTLDRRLEAIGGEILMTNTTARLMIKPPSLNVLPRRRSGLRHLSCQDLFISTPF
jgi:hypothetical protein